MRDGIVFPSFMSTDESESKTLLVRTNSDKSGQGLKPAMVINRTGLSTGRSSEIIKADSEEQC